MQQAIGLIPPSPMKCETGISDSLVAQGPGSVSGYPHPVFLGSLPVYLRSEVGQRRSASRGHLRSRIQRGEPYIHTQVTGEGLV